MTENRPKQVLVLKPGEGRKYPMGRMSAVFKADLDETSSALSVSEWWLDANTEGPHVHQHPEDHLFYVIEGSVSVYLQDRGWCEAPKGSYLYIPGGIEHSFQNRSDKTAGFMSINTPGGFEESVKHFGDYFKEHPLGDAVPRPDQAGGGNDGNQGAAQPEMDMQTTAVVITRNA